MVSSTATCTVVPVPHTCHERQHPAVSRGRSRALARRLAGPLLSKLTTCAEYDGKATDPDVGTIQLVRPQAVSPVLPIISLGKLGNERDESVRLREATHDVGFFYLVDHGVPASLEGDLLRVGRELFALPDADKSAIDMMNSPHFRGFTRLGGERTQGRQDWREQIDIGAERPGWLWRSSSSGPRKTAGAP